MGPILTEQVGRIQKSKRKKSLGAPAAVGIAFTPGARPLRAFQPKGDRPNESRPCIFVCWHRSAEIPGVKLFRLQTSIQPSYQLDESMWVQIFAFAAAFETAMEVLPFVCHLRVVPDLLCHVFAPAILWRRGRDDRRRGRFSHDGFPRLDACLDYQPERARVGERMTPPLLKGLMKGLEGLPISVFELDVDVAHGQSPNAEELLSLCSVARRTYPCMELELFQRPWAMIEDGDAPFCDAAVA